MPEAALKTWDDFHDWYLDSVSVGPNAEPRTLTLGLYLDVANFPSVHDAELNGIEHAPGARTLELRFRRIGGEIELFRFTGVIGRRLIDFAVQNVASRLLISSWYAFSLAEIRTWVQWINSRDDSMRLALGAMSVQSVGPADIVAEIERYKLGWVEHFSLWCVVRGIFKHAAGKKLVHASPCAGIQLEAIIGKRPPVKKWLMLTADELHAVLTAKMSPENLLSVSILAATGVRSEELFTSEKANLFLDESRWHIPASKTGPAMDIPLASVVVEWFRELLALSAGSAYVLPTRAASRAERQGGDAHVNRNTIGAAITFWLKEHKPKVRHFTPHDLRSTMKSHMRALGVSRDVSEMCLNHRLAGVEGIYDQHSYYEERREALELWAAFLDTCRRGKEWNVTPMRRSA